jgi:uncharacterized Zn-finger protein
MAIELKIPPMHFANDVGVDTIRISVRAFKCIGARPPMDHPHIFLDMGDAGSIVCPYCSTKFIFDSRIAAGSARPIDAIYKAEK